MSDDTVVDGNAKADERQVIVGKRIESFAATYNAYIGTAMEKDKSLLTLAAGGIGILAVLSTAIKHSSLLFGMLLIGLLLFLSSIFLILSIFSKNALIMRLIINAEKGTANIRRKRFQVIKRKSRRVTVLDKRTCVSFVGGVLITASIALILAWPKAEIIPAKIPLPIHPPEIKRMTEIKNQAATVDMTKSLGGAYSIALNPIPPAPAPTPVAPPVPVPPVAPPQAASE